MTDELGVARKLAGLEAVRRAFMTEEQREQEDAGARIIADLLVRSESEAEPPQTEHC
jgi:hypothetical protein